VSATAVSGGKKKAKMGNNKVPKPNPAKKVSREAKNATAIMAISN
jgi:hypothetical protein